METKDKDERKFQTKKLHKHKPIIFCRKIHFVWFGKKIPEKYVNNIQTFRRNNPYYEVKNKKVCKENNKSIKYHNNTINGKRREY